MAETVDILIAGGTVLTVNDRDTKLEGGAIAVDKDTIVALGRKEDILSAYRGRVTIDVPGSIIMPGLVNAHTHAAMTCFRGIADDMELMEWLNDYIFPRRGPKCGSRTGLLGKYAGLCGDDQIGDDNLLRHVYFRGGGSQSGQAGRDALSPGGGSIRFSIPQF